MKKKIAGLLFLSVVAIFCIVSAGRTNYKSYYSGDAVNYQGDLIIASTDSGSLEVFKLEDKTLVRALKFKAPNSPLDKTDDFSSVKLNEENGRLFAYATSAYTLYKYDISNLANPVVFAKQKNTYYEWYKRVDKFGSNIVTVSDKNVRLWRTDSLDVIDSFKIENDVNSSVRFDALGRYITYINKDNVARIYDIKTRSVISSFAVNYRGTDNQRKTYFDPIAQELYIFDDYFLKRYNLEGDLLVSYPNSSRKGYGVEPTGDSSYVYAINGDSIMKLSKENLKSGLKVSAYSASSNGFAMGVKYVDLNGDDNVVIFNGGGISVLNSSLHKIASIAATEIAEQPEVKESLALSLDHYKATTGASVVLNGAGYLPGEVLKIKFAEVITEVNADRNGRFTKTLTVPSAHSNSVDIKVDGLSSKLTYSVSFQIIK